MRVVVCLLLLLLAGCQPIPSTDALTDGIEPAAQHDVLGVSTAQLQVDYWLAKRPQPDAVLLNADAIEAFNQQTYALQPEMVKLSSLPQAWSAEQLQQAIDSISRVPKYPRFYANGQQASEAQLADYRAAANIAGVQQENPIRFGLALQRAAMRTFPTNDKLYSAVDDLDIDRFQETAVFPGWPLAIVHTSADGQWYLAQSYHYLAWIEARYVALGERQSVLAYAERQPFLQVTAAKAWTNYNPHQPAHSELQLDMSTRLPLLTAAEVGTALHGQNPYASHAVLLPQRDSAGQLTLAPALIARHQATQIGYLPYTEANILRQAFNFLGERYGWGHDYNARDCTGFVSEVYRTMGIEMPRNSGQQGHGEFGHNIRFEADTPVAEKLQYLAELNVGDLLYLPGHVVMYIGHVGDEPYVIHDVHGLRYRDADGNPYKGILNGVSVTPLTTLYVNEQDSYLNRIYAIKSIR
ncbi:SH3 domain-containing protein [Pseudidiomarina mangrovi]|uniref:C40 family peptidase n=1 Tax=Pseudidiomarina mangrovi TaxID=2487133 RepID=UPI000FCBD83A|nr:SH3 domain-containing protein [Pseudidiomarina mangrovi]